MNKLTESKLRSELEDYYRLSSSDLLVEAHRRANDAKWVVLGFHPILWGASAVGLAWLGSLDITWWMVVLPTCAICFVLVGMWESFLHHRLRERVILQEMERRNQQLSS